MATTKPRVLVTIDEEMESAIRDFRFNNRYETQSEAVRELLRLGIERAMEKLNNVAHSTHRG